MCWRLPSDESVGDNSAAATSPTLEASPTPETSPTLESSPSSTDPSSLSPSLRAPTLRFSASCMEDELPSPSLEKPTCAEETDAQETQDLVGEGEEWSGEVEGEEWWDEAWWGEGEGEMWQGSDDARGPAKLQDDMEGSSVPGCGAQPLQPRTVQPSRKIALKLQSLSQPDWSPPQAKPKAKAKSKTKPAPKLKPSASKKPSNQPKNAAQPKKGERKQTAYSIAKQKFLEPYRDLNRQVQEQRPVDHLFLLFPCRFRIVDAHERRRWKESEERKEFLKGLTLTEIKRRRY